MADRTVSPQTQSLARPRLTQGSADAFRQVPTRAVLGSGVVSQLGRLIRKEGDRALIVTGQRSSRINGALEKALTSLAEAKVNATVYDQVACNPSTETVLHAFEFARHSAASVLVAIGGGSAIDTAKAAGILLRHGGDLCQYFGRGRVPGPVTPLVAVPTTAGSGSEVSPYAVVVDVATHTKENMSSPHLYPALALLDSNLTLTLPSDLTLFTGVDALAHAVEGAMSNRAQPVTDRIARQSIRIILEALPIACTQPGDQYARHDMLHAACLSGVVLAHAHTTLAHKMGHLLTLDYGIQHGFASGLLLPGVLAYNGPMIPERVAEIARTLDPSPLRHNPAVEAAARLRCFLDKLGFPRRVTAEDAKTSHAQTLAERVMARPERLSDNPRAPTLDDLKRMYSEVL